LSTYGSTFDTLLAVYTGTSLTNLVEVASSDDEESNDPGASTNRFFASVVHFERRRERSTRSLWTDSTGPGEATS
jgi:hypothetical protein